MRKVFILFLSMIFTLSSVFTAFASSNPTTLKEDVDLISVYEQMDAEISSTIKDGSECFSISINGTNSTANVEKMLKENGDILYCFQEGDKYNEITLTKDKELLLDGKPLMITDETNKNLQPLTLSNKNFNQIDSMGARRMYWTDTAPYGSNSDYTKLFATNKRQVGFAEKELEVIGVTAFGAIIAAALGMSGIGSFATGVVIATIYDGLIKNDPKSRSCSVKDANYEHKTKGMNVSSTMSVTRHEITYYANSNYTSPINPVQKGFQVFTY